MGLLSGLEKLGFKSLDKVDLYEDENAKKSAVVNEKKELTEADMIYEKTCTCPVCQKKFKTKAMRVGKAKLLSSDVDLRPIYSGVDTLKYDVIVCHSCGFAALSRFFEVPMTDTQIRLIQQSVSANYKDTRTAITDICSYDEAIEGHKLALLNAIVKKSKASEKAYICLKTAWLLRGKYQNYAKDATDYDAVVADCKEEEQQYLEEAKKGFIVAIEKESGNICGMDPATVEYICAAIAYEIGEYDESQRMISRLIVNPSANRRIKDKCLDLKERIAKEK